MKAAIIFVTIVCAAVVFGRVGSVAAEDSCVSDVKWHPGIQIHDQVFSRAIRCRISFCCMICTKHLPLQYLRIFAVVTSSFELVLQGHHHPFSSHLQDFLLAFDRAS
jgi:hypothetical protein